MKRKSTEYDQNPLIRIQILLPKDTIKSIKQKSKATRMPMSTYLRNKILEFEATLN